jgi:uncharacterized membrane protein YkoI
MKVAKLKKSIAITILFLLVGIISFVIYQKQNTVIPEAKAKEIAIENTNKLSNLQWEMTGITLEDNRFWVVDFSAVDAKEAMKVYVDVHTGKVVDVKQCCG